MFLKRRALMTRASFNYKTVSGIGSIVLENCVETKFKRLSLLGNSKQTTTKGINLLPFKVGEKIISSDEKCEAITKKDGVDITIKAGAVNDVKSDIYFIGNGNGLGGDESAYELFQEGDYTFINNTNNQLYLFVIAWRNGEKKTLISGSRVILNNFTINKNDKVRIFLRPSNTSQTYFLEKASVMLCKHTEANLPYEPYTGGKPSPSPEYPQNTYGTGKKGKNLFDISKLKSGIIPTENINIEESTITLPVGGAIYFNKLKDVCTDLKVGDEVYLFVKSTGTRAFVGFHNETISISSWSFNTKRTVTESMLDSALLLYSDTDKSVVISDIMITKVNDKTYEPYLDKFLVDVSVTGKNLFDKTKIQKGYYQDVQGNLIKYDEAFCVSDYIKISDSQSNLCITGLSNATASFVVIFDKDKNRMYSENNYDILSNKGIIEMRKGAKYVRFASRNIENVQVEYGNQSTPYEPYHEPQTIQLQLDEPLRGIGEYKDVITKDGILRKIKEIVLDESTGFETYWATLNKTFAFISPIIKDATVINGTPNRLLCNYSKALSYGLDYTDEEVCVLFNRRFHIRFLKERNIDTVEKLKEWLKQNPIKIQYLLQEPVLETFENNLGNLHANDGTTVITVDSGEVETGIEVEYAIKN